MICLSRSVSNKKSRTTLRDYGRFAVTTKRKSLDRLGNDWFGLMSLLFVVIGTDACMSAFLLQSGKIVNFTL